MSSVISFREKVSKFFTVPEDVKKIGHDIKDIATIIAKKIVEFVKKNKTFLFFASTVLFAYYMAPVAAGEYLSYFGYSLTDVFIEGMGFGSSLLAIANVFNLKEITKHADDRMNVLAGVSNLCQIFLCPTQGLVASFATGGLIVAKTAYRSFFDIADRRVYVMIPRNQ